MRQVRPAPPGAVLRTHRHGAGPRAAGRPGRGHCDRRGRDADRPRRIAVRHPGVDRRGRRRARGAGSGVAAGAGRHRRDAGRPDPWRRARPWRRPVGAHRPDRGGDRTGRGRVRAARHALVVRAPPGRVQGGAVAMLAGAAMEAAMQTAAPAREPRSSRWRSSSTTCGHWPATGARPRPHATLVHGGRRTAVARAEITDADGRGIAVASGSAIAERAGS